MNKKFEIYSFSELEDKGYKDKDILKSALSISTDTINNYSLSDGDSKYWLLHRIANKNLFYGALVDKELVGHFSALRVSSSEIELFTREEIEETDFSVFDANRALNENYYIYIAAIAVKKEYRGSRVTPSLFRKTMRELSGITGNSHQYQGLAAEAYSNEGERICKMLNMKKVNNMIYLS